jgi:hypothetical protein
MNPLNHASLEASRRLQAKGIMLETEKNWYILDGKAQEYSWLRTEETIIPRPLMAEVWRELPEILDDSNYCYRLRLSRFGGKTKSFYEAENGFTKGEFRNVNPTDALIDLLIFTVEQGKEKKL